MRDLATMLWKEFLEVRANRRFAIVFVLMALLMGVLPLTSSMRSRVPTVEGLFFILIASVVVVAQTAPDLVLHERLGHTMDYLLTTRLPSEAIFGAKVLVAMCMGYAAALATLAVQLVVLSLSGVSWQWVFLTTSGGRIVAFGLPIGISLYMAVVGTLVALRIGDQRAAYLVSMLSLAIWMLPFFTGWLHLETTTQWMTEAVLVLAGAAVVLGLIGMRIFRRDMLVLYLQE